MGFKTKEQTAVYNKKYRLKHLNYYVNYGKCYYDANRRYFEIKGKEHRKEYQRLLEKLKNKPCADCYGWFEPCQMDFDHLDSSTKMFQISHSPKSLKTILEEIKKCELVCANCHRLRTVKRYYSLV
jgi:hypothetical protein